MKKPPSTESLPAVPEICSFEGGLKKARVQIAELLKEKDYVVMAINGSGPEVGKTFLTGEIARGFLEEGVPIGICTDNGNFVCAEEQLATTQALLEKCDRGIYILGAWEASHGCKKYGKTDVRAGYDEMLKEAARKIGLSLSKVDIWVAIYKKDKPFHIVKKKRDDPYDPFEDIIICNDQ
ncbi:hypothetical protein KJ657_04920 [Patescibacteria group bacterium]|nr:hypothetical protein [Patescibacteria group bacterium]MBU1016397.1 hypothetical protein [Patescibacteria group bacterium]MBU1685145.1 hypothetical protein [Patescibacteria group bacterium]MBU1938802.1 hypothetical protein [Patescibacteria group bacterium]